ncbi:MAG: MFS transporter [Bdellovibrionales bacterium]|nr:MFS transporter [Bdellovibrionales bacterium]
MSARFLFTFGVQMQAVVVAWRIYDLMGEPLYLGLVGLAEAIPALGLALFAGHLVDHGNPLIIYRRVLSLSFFSGLIVYSAHSVPLLFQHQVFALYSASVLTGIARAFSQPTIFAIVPQLLDRDKISRGAAWMSSSMQVARIAGPAVGGLVFGWLGVTVSTAVIALLLLGAALTLSTIHPLPTPSPQPTTPLTEKSSLRESLLSGVQFVFNHEILLPALLLDMLSVLFGGVTALLPIFAKDILFIGPKGLGLLRATPALGAALMGIYLANRTLGARAGKILLYAVAGFGICIIIFGLSQNLTLSLTALFLSGAFDSVSMVVRGTAVQLSSPSHMRGRISAVNSIFIGSSNELGELESGLVAQWIGPIRTVLFGGVACLLIVATIAWKSPALRKMNLKEL